MRTRTFPAVFAAALAMALGSAIARAADDKKDESGKRPTVTGILIDQKCGATMMEKDNPERAAADHSIACAKKEACAASGYAVITGKRMLKFDENGNKLAKEYLEKNDHTKVAVMGTENGDQIAVTSIKPEEQVK